MHFTVIIVLMQFNKNDINQNNPTATVIKCGVFYLYNIHTIK